jgi:hypothetical protein
MALYMILNINVSSAIVAMTPISVYLMGSPIFGLKALAIPLLLAGVAIAVNSRRQALAWLLLLPQLPLRLFLQRIFCVAL